MYLPHYSGGTMLAKTHHFARYSLPLIVAIILAVAAFAVYLSAAQPVAAQLSEENAMKIQRLISNQEHILNTQDIQRGIDADQNREIRDLRETVKFLAGTTSAVSVLISIGAIYAWLTGRKLETVPRRHLRPPTCPAVDGQCPYEPED